MWQQANAGSDPREGIGVDVSSANSRPRREPRSRTALTKSTLDQAPKEVAVPAETRTGTWLPKSVSTASSVRQSFFPRRKYIQSR